MLKTYFKSAIRNLGRNKIFSLITISGLSVGLACCMLILLYAKDEVSFDRFFHNHENIYRIVTDMVRQDGNKETFGSTGMMPGPGFKAEIPEVESYVRVGAVGFNVKSGTEVFEQEALYTDVNFFQVFSFQLMEGNRATALQDPHSVVLSEEVAEKYFGTQQALGQVMELSTGEDFEPYVVTAVIKKSPENSSLKIKMLVPIASNKSWMEDHHWANFFLNTFLVLKSGADMNAVEKKMATVYESQSANELKEMKELFGWSDNVMYHLQPLLQMHLSTAYAADNGLSRASKPVYSYILTGIALLILLIACINFINLTVARSIKRSREIGIRKVIGGRRGQLISQFLGESFLLSLVAFVVAVPLVLLVLPFFNSLAGKELSFSYLLDVKLITGYVCLFIFTGMMAGFYPALVLSRFNPVHTLYGRFRFNMKNYLSKGLIVFQFTLATFLIIATIVIYSQFNFLLNYDLGYNDKNVVALNTGSINRTELEYFKQELLKDPGIQSVTAEQGGRWSTLAHINGDKEIGFDIKCVDENYVPLLGLPLLSGRNFSHDFPSDSAQSVIVNEAFVKKAGWKDPIGQVVDFFYYNRKFNVIGVVKDYHFLPLTEKIPPELLTMNPAYNYSSVLIKLRPGAAAATLPFIGKKFREVFPLQPYRYSYKDADNAQQYESESKWKSIISFGALLTIFISCIGLFGLIMLAAEKRTKEIGIRKVLGASIGVIVKTLSGDFLKLVLVAAVIAAPAAWLVMNKWLENYPYRVDVAWWMFASSTLFIIVVAFVTMSLHTVRAAVANPAKSLRTE